MSGSPISPFPGASQIGSPQSIGLAFTPTRPLTVTMNVAEGTADDPGEEDEIRRMPYDGWLAELFVRWEDGTNSLVGVRMAKGRGENGEKIVPFNEEDEFLSLNDVSRTYPLWIPVEEDDPYRFTVQNRDGDNGHAISIDMLIVKYIPALHDRLPSVVLPGRGQ